MLFPAMLRSQVRHNSTAQVVQAQLSARLDEYFATTKFDFAQSKHVDELRRIMKLVYLRKRPLVAIDIEAYERKPKLITELGIAIYDPANQWLSAQPHIKTVHIISHENKRLLNSRFVPNNKYRFNGGVSHQMTQKQSSQYLRETFEYYFRERKAVIVGHSLGGDLRWLQSHGVGNTEHTPQVDTQKLFMLSRKRGATLRGILEAIDIPHSNLHNAANDAYYTLLAAMAYCDPERRRHFGLDTYLATQALTDKDVQEASRRKNFIDSTYVSQHAPPPVTYRYPTNGEGSAQESGTLSEETVESEEKGGMAVEVEETKEGEEDNRNEGTLDTQAAENSDGSRKRAEKEGSL